MSEEDTVPVQFESKQDTENVTLATETVTLATETGYHSNLDSYSLIDQPELSIDPASVCPDEDTTTSEDISVLGETDADTGEVKNEDTSEQISVEEETVEEAGIVVEEAGIVVEEAGIVVEEALVAGGEAEVPVEEEVVMEELVSAVNEEQPPVVELELAPEEETEPPQVVLEDVTAVESIPEIKSEPPQPEPEQPSEPEKSPEPEKSQEHTSEPEKSPEHASEPEKSPEHTSDSDPGSASDVGIPDVELKPAEPEPEQEPSDNTPKTKPIIHIISSVFLAVTLALLSIAGEENLPNRTETALSSLLFTYLLTYAAADQEILVLDQLTSWLNSLFNLVLCPFLVTYLGYTVSSCTGVCDLGLMVPTLAALLGVELWVLMEHVEVLSVVQGVAGTLGGVVLHNHFRELGEAGNEGLIQE